MVDFGRGTVLIKKRLEIEIFSRHSDLFRKPSGFLVFWSTKSMTPQHGCACDSGKKLTIFLDIAFGGLITESTRTRKIYGRRTRQGLIRLGKPIFIFRNHGEYSGCILAARISRLWGGILD